MSLILKKQACIGAFLAVFGGGLLSGCVTDTLRTSVQESKLKDTLRLYESTVRWGALERMYGYLSPEERENVKIPPGLGNVQVISYETAIPLAPIDENRYQHTAGIRYVLKDQQVVRTITDYQIWEMDPESKNWFRVNPIPPF